MGERERLVLETDSSRKSALQTILRDRGVTVSDWFEEQLDLLLTDHTHSAYVGEEQPEAQPESDPIAAIESVDWAFADADTSYLSHDIHPYPAKFIPQIPATAIRLLSARGDLVLDPFGGSGTTALEALRLGRRAVSLDANPLSALVGRVKTARLTEPDRTGLRAFRTYLTTQLRDLPRPPERLIEKCGDWIPRIPNLEKWFSPESVGELAMIRAAAHDLPEVAHDVAMLALSRIVVSASFQDSETRYASKPRDVEAGATLRMFLATLDVVLRRVEKTASTVRYGLSDFRTCDARELRQGILPDCSVDLVVTSPPYGNATDYHLYHRFRLFWIGEDPVAMGRIEIGSHLRHQREKTGFEDYLSELKPCLEGLHRVMKPDAHAFFVVGDSVYHGERYETAEKLSALAEDVGLQEVALVRRPLPEHRRSFSAAARRAVDEKVLVLKKADTRVRLELLSPRYQLWPYEEMLKDREIQARTSAKVGGGIVTIPSHDRLKAKRLAFTRGFRYPGGHVEPTWQHILENGYVADGSARKDPKYVAHGIHPYKGKFYPQLAKALLNVAGVAEGSTVLDPFCGSGTTLLEARLNGLRAFGCDLNPLAAKIARAKVGILDLDPSLVLDAVRTLEERLSSDTTPDTTEVLTAIPSHAHEEVRSWFAWPVALKVDRVLGAIRGCSGGILREYLEVLLSSILREVSQQEPRDLRIRRRKIPLEDADVYGMFLSVVREQVDRLEHFWEIRGHSPYPFPEATVAHGDARSEAVFNELGLVDDSVDCVLTSPPYATALPYLDTDRLSLLILFGLTSRERRPLEHDLTGSREISVTDRRELEAELRQKVLSMELPGNVVAFIDDLLGQVETADVGFRRRNKPGLLLRFFRDMHHVLTNSCRLLRPGGELVMVIGDNTTSIDGEEIRIPTTEFLKDIACHIGLELVEAVSIDVTTENLKHIRHAIKANEVYRLKKPV